MTSILDGLKGFVTPAFISSVSAQTGESDAAVARGLSAVLPAFLSSVAERSSDSGFMTQLSRLAAGAGHPEGSGAGWATAAAAMVPGLFGSRLSGVTDTLARYAGIRPASAASLLAAAAPLVLGYLGRLMNRDHLDVSGLGRKLRDERQAFASAIPGGFDWVPAGDGDLSGATRLLSDADRRMDSGTRWALPVVLGGLALLGLLWLMGRNRGDDIQAVVGETVSSAAAVADRAVAAVARTLPGGLDIQVFPGSLEDRLMGYLAAPTSSSDVFAFDRIGFETGSASLTPQSRAQLTNVAAIFKAYPGAGVAIEGHTDDVGDAQANMGLSTTRAASVLQALRAEGVTNEITANGYGSTRPVADNATETGRAANRRVALRISTSPKASDQSRR